MAARYFLIGETGDAGAWLVDVDAGTVQRIEADALASGAGLPDGDLVSNLADLRADGDYTVLKGVDLAIAAESLDGPSGHIRREGGD